MNDLLKNVLLWVVIAVILMSVFNNLGGQRYAGVEVPYSEFMSQVESGQIQAVTMEGREISGLTTSSTAFRTYSPETDNTALIGVLLDSNVAISAKAPEKTGVLMQIFISWFPFLLLIGVWIFFMRQMQGGGGGRGAMSFGKSKARMLGEDQVKVTFADVAGVDEAKEEVGELVEFLRDPGKFQKFGGKIPRGILMVGSPGTGKTLLAKAIAGEAKVPFFTISGSDFVEMFVGVGASRVRDMFEQAKKHSPCIIFIDEIDAVGRHRGAGVGGGHDEREQTLNQLLVEMDGFEGNEGVIVIAATNRPDVLDPALLRPGRFDRQVVVPLPDVRGREQILRVHMSKVPVDDDVRADLLARGTPGFSGADLANLVNEAALFAARGNSRTVTMEEFEKAKDKIMMGAERKSMVMSEDERKLTAYHEAGHAIVGRLVPEHDPVYKVTIIPRGRALGVTMFLPEEDRYSHSRRRLESQIATLYGGRIAEEFIFGDDAVTTGASNDIERATELARNMVTKWGLSDKLGPLSYSEEQGEPFLGRSTSAPSGISGATAKTIDEEVRAVIDRNYQQAEQILRDNMDKLHVMSDALMKYETIDVAQIDAIMEGRQPGPPADWSDEPPPSDQGGGAGAANTDATGPSSQQKPDDPPLSGPAEQH
ncbi:MAG: ATP-dependent zinc metalloprotease FtsH [Granulosicoccaceae bacterium]